MNYEGILPIDKPTGPTSFDIIRQLRLVTREKKIGHSGTLDPFASGVLILLIGRRFTRLSNLFVQKEKEYTARIHLGIATDTFDHTGSISQVEKREPTEQEIREEILPLFQGEILQMPPMFSAKKVGGKKLYALARKGIEIEREPQKVQVEMQFIQYRYPSLDVQITCSKGTYIRSLADEIGKKLGCGAHLSALRRTKNGSFSLKDCFEGKLLYEKSRTREETLQRMLPLLRSSFSENMENHE